jgi:hypothetical protein
MKTSKNSKNSKKSKKSKNRKMYKWGGSGEEGLVVCVCLVFIKYRGCNRDG